MSDVPGPDVVAGADLPSEQKGAAPVVIPMDSPAGSSVTAPVPPVGVTRLVLTDFRSYAHARLETDVRPVVLTGPNGAGKTNLLEAVSFLAPGRGLRRARLHEVVRHGVPDGVQGAWAVAARIQTPTGEVAIGTGRAAGPSDRRIVQVNGEPARSQADLGAVVSAIWLTPAMDRLLAEAASARRRFFDRLVFGLYPDHAGRLSAYETAWKQRNRLLKEGTRDRAWFEGLEEAMAGHGVAVAAARRDVAARLSQGLSEQTGPFPSADIGLDGFLERLLEDHTALEAEEAYRRLLTDGRSREAAGAPGEGPHRTDLVVHHRGKGLPAVHCSTGEQKAVLIAVLLAQARVQALHRGMAPILLLDEVAAHLDAERRDALYDSLCALGAQAWLTGTDRSLFASFGDRAQFFEVRDGGLH